MNSHNNGWGTQWPEPLPQVKVDFGNTDKTVVNVAREGHLTSLEVKTMTLELMRKDGWPVTISAMQVGDLAIHDDVNTPETWMITHIPTLLSFNSALPDGNYVEEDLIKWCAIVQTNHRNGWDYLRKLNKNDKQYADVDILRTIQNWCLSVKVV